ncbi:MAG TPA: DNA polymerase III subunit beta [Solirubrobacterales bacterium]|nr:DNA polymerase III subunit beta [Solirubrobacterales bacterium]
MKITTSRQSLLDALLIVSRAVSTRAALQALSGILFTTDGGARVRATDMELGLEVGLEGEVEGGGAVVLPGRLLVEVARSLPNGGVSLALREAERDVEISAASSRFHLRTLPPDDFPRFPDPEGDPVELPALPLRDTINRVARAASRDEARPVLTGVLVTVEGDEMTMVATDSYRLAVKRTKLEAPVPDRLEANVPARALRELARLTEVSGNDPLRVWLTRNQAIFRVGPVSLNSRLIDGQFPNHSQLLPESYEHEVRLPRVELLEVTRRVSQLAQRNAALRLSFSEGELLVSAETPDLGDAREALPAPYSGELLEIGFNPEFVRDGLESIDSDEVVLKLISPLRPGLLEPADGHDFSYLVMPIRLNV